MEYQIEILYYKSNNNIRFKIFFIYVKLIQLIKLIIVYFYKIFSFKFNIILNIIIPIENKLDFILNKKIFINNSGDI